MPTDQEIISLVRKQLELQGIKGVTDEQIAATLPFARAMKRAGWSEREMLDMLVAASERNDS